MDTGLAGQVVLVTGASGGIGSGIARAFAAEGARVILHYRSGRDRVTTLEKELGQDVAFPLRADLANEAQTKRLFDHALRRFDRIDTLIVNAAAWETRDVPLHEMTLSQWEKTIDNALTSAFLSLRAFFQVVARQKRGNAVLIASTAGVFGEANHVDYAAAKSALAAGMVRSLKNEIVRLAPHTRDYCGGRVNCICPGWTVVPRLAAKLGDHKIIRKVTATMALKQLARPEDIANAAVFLSSDRLARHITGQTLVIAGGMEGRLLWQPEEIDPTIV